MTNKKKKNYYDILEVSKDSSDLTIKKAYRRLALLHHPDRNNGSPESTEQFQLIGEAFQCLSNPTSRRDYDAHLLNNEGGGKGYTTSWSPSQNVNTTSATATTTTTSSTGSTFPHGPTMHNFGRWNTGYQPNVRFDPYEQFDYLFRQDPFFQEAFKDMDEEFARRFHANDHCRGPSSSSAFSPGRNDSQRRTSTNPSSQSAYYTATTTSSRNNQNNHSPPPPPPSSNVSSKEGWLPWLLRLCGIEFHMTSVSVDRNGGMMRTTYSSTSHERHGGGYGHGGYGSSSKGRSGYSTQRMSETYQDSHGRIVTVQRIQQNGNQIEDKLVNNRLVQRKVNGIIEPLERIAGGQSY